MGDNSYASQRAEPGHLTEVGHPPRAHQNNGKVRGALLRLGPAITSRSLDCAFVTRLRTLTSLRDEEIDALVGLMRDRQTITPERQLVDEGDRPERTHILLDGWAARVKLLPNGSRHFGTLLVPGDVCDIDGLLVRHYDYGVVALTPCTFASIDRQDLLDLCDARPAIARVFTWLTFVDNAMLNEAAVSLARRSAAERLAYLLCELMTRLTLIGRAQADGFAFPVTQDKIADTLGLTGVHVNRTLRELRTQGLADVVDRAVIFLNWNGLKRLAGFSADYLHLEGMRKATAS